MNNNQNPIARFVRRLKFLLFDKALPIYIPASRRFSDKLHLAIWNCGTRPQTFWRAICDTRITIRKGHGPIFVIKKGSV